MNLNNHCPVQASIDSYCAQLGEDDAFDMAVDDRKEEIMNYLAPEHIQEALSEVPQTSELWKDIAHGAKVFNTSNRIHLDNADDVLRGLFNAVEVYAEMEALRQIRAEQDNPPEDKDDDY